jgi:serine/threonine-protein kinase HipA
MNRELVVLSADDEIGRISRNQDGRLSLAYQPDWRESRTAYPISLSLPLSCPEHSHDAIEAYLWGLLPDNAQVVENWARRFQVSARNAFALISHVGEDCAGALQFVAPERLQRLLTEPAKSEVVWLREGELAERLRQLRLDHSAWRAPSDVGQFTLAGAQPKTALLLREGRWGVPSGRTPTTHILKPPTGEWDGHAENEHLCLELAATLGLVTSRTSVRHFQDEVAIIIERFDRIATSSGLLRIHQEDTCQALALLPTRKYESDGGRDVQELADLIRRVSNSPEEDVQCFVEALAFNWLIGGTDAHAKNYSILIRAETSVRLAPLYDVASILPYRGIQFPKLKMAMKIGGQYRLRMIGVRQWRKLSNELRLNEESLIQRLRELAAAMPDQVVTLRDQLIAKDLKHPIIRRLADVIAKRAKACAEYLDM